MAVKQHINHGVIQKVCYLHNVTLSHFLNFTLSPPLCYSLKITNYGMKEERSFEYMAASAYHVVSKEVKNRVFRHNHIFRHTCMHNETILASSGIIITLCKYYIVISDTLIGP